MFKLSPNNRDQSDEVLLDDLRAVSLRLGKAKITRHDYDCYGRFAPATIANRFGGWGRALDRAGLDAPRHFSVSAEEALVDLQAVAARLKVSMVSLALYRTHGKFSEKPFDRHFGSWVNALSAAGLQASERYNPRITDEALLENLELVWQGLGRQPTVSDMCAPRSRYSADTYKRRFGGWRKTLEAFVAASSAEASSESTHEVSTPAHAAPLEPSTGRTRAVGWRLRYRVLSSDRFACRACGRSPAAHPGLELQVDHIVPWSKGGRTVEANLQSLCKQCNGGKGAI